jgi:AcrR family transcriptional regulator
MTAAVDKQWPPGHPLGWMASQLSATLVEAMADASKTKQILKAAGSSIAEKGYSQTTISEVAARAGVSRGLLHYYFKNKDELMAAVVRSHMEQAMGMIAAMFSQAQSLEALSRSLSDGLKLILREKPGFFTVFFEVWAIGRQSAVVQTELEILYRRFRLAIQEGLQDAVQRGILDPPAGGSLDGRASMLTAVIDGLGLQMITEPELVENEAIWEACYHTVLRMLGP